MSEAVKERPILFSEPMVRALLAGTKTQTRRIWKMPRGLEWYTSGALRGMETGDIHDPLGPWWGHVSEVRCPHGRPDDRLWVREAWRACAEADAVPPRDMDAAFRVWCEADAPHQPGAGKYRPPMFMPRWASRITLEITEVRVERLQDISEADAKAEGASMPDGTQTPPEWWSYRQEYAHLWDRINGTGSWDENPWVWVVEFTVET